LLVLLSFGGGAPAMATRDSGPVSAAAIAEEIVVTTESRTTWHHAVRRWRRLRRSVSRRVRAPWRRTIRARLPASDGTGWPPMGRAPPALRI
jgi:hypothetical protein